LWEGKKGGPAKAGKRPGPSIEVETDLGEALLDRRFYC
jgi:hypothetical protein